MTSGEISSRSAGRPHPDYDRAALPTSGSTSPVGRAHLIPMIGRDPHEPHRASSTLELLFDLTFVAAFAITADNVAEAAAEGHWHAALFGFTMAMFGTCWAWINFSWFASAYDTDDWAYRLTTMLQMVGVVIFALGIGPLFAALAQGRLDNRVMVAGYVVMRVAMIVQWLRAAKHDPAHRATCLTYARTIALAQAGWVLLVVFPPQSQSIFVACIAILMVIEVSGPVRAERRGHTPWHAHHIAERYGLLTIIALGEGITGTVVSVSALVGEQGWSWQAVCLVIAGVGLTFGIWWTYTIMPSAQVLHLRRTRAFGWGYGHVLVFASIVAVGAGLQLVAHSFRHDSELSATIVGLACIVPVTVFLLVLYVLYTVLLGTPDAFHLVLGGAGLAVALLAYLLTAAGVALPVVLLVLTAAPLPAIVGFEWWGRQRQDLALSRLAEQN